MNVLSLFSGIAGLDLGIRLALPAARVVGYVEQDPYCQRVLLARMRDGSLDTAPIWDNVVTFRGEPWRGHVDMVCGGFPCTDVSNAGRRAGITSETRSGLWFEMARIIGEVRPRYVYVENVSALLVRGMGTVLGDLSALGYDAEWLVMAAAAVGAPHLRKRVFILAESQRLRGERRRDARDVASQSGEVEGEARQWQWSGHAADDCSAGVLADAERAERRQDALPRSGGGEGRDREGEAAGGTGECSVSLADASECGRGASQPDLSGEPQPDAAGRCRGPVAHGRSERLEGDGEAGPAARPVGRGGGAVVVHAEKQPEREPDDEACAVAWERAREDAGRGLPLFPPGPAGGYAWTEILERAPWLVPAISEAEAERLFRGVAHGFPPGVYRQRAKDRVQRLRALGNAVVPQATALALLVLLERLGE